jgi:DNA-binding SARP family transcriptional activator/DNA-binding XRE family transcriptional regulator
MVLIRRLRQSAGMTQSQLAVQVGLSVGAIRDIEQGRVTSPRRDSACRLAEALGLDAADSIAEAITADRAGEVVSSGAARDHASPGRGLAGIEINVLGSLTVWRDGVQTPLGRAGQRAVLGLLAVSPGSVLHRDLIIDALWGGRPPAKAVSIVQTHVSRLRTLLGVPARGRAGILVAEGASYRLQVTTSQLDLLGFERLTNLARAAVVNSDPSAACGLYEGALHLWRGAPLADIEILRGHPAVRFVAQQAWTVVAEFAEIACGAGRYGLPLPYLRAGVLADSLNERTHSWLMIALAGSGQQAEALHVYDEIRRRLDEELGMLPCAGLAEVHSRILRREIAAPRLGVRDAGGAWAALVPGGRP